MNDKERFLSKIKHTDSCWNYQGGISTNGYGIFWMKGKSFNSHKAAYMLLISSVPNDKWVLHTCDNKKCVNPSHLYLGTREDNTKDAVTRNRMATGARHGSKTNPMDRSFENTGTSKLTKVECLDINHAINNGVHPHSLANYYRVHLATIYRASKRIELLKQLEQ